MQAVKMMVSLPKRFPDEIDQVARQERRTRSEALRAAARLCLEARRERQRPITDPAVRQALATQDELARRLQQQGVSDGTADLRPWRGNLD